MEKVYFNGVHTHSKCVPGNPVNLINLNLYWISKSTCAHTQTHTHTHKQFPLIS